MRWLYHLVAAADAALLPLDSGGELRPASLATEGFVHCSYQEAVVETARLYFREDPSALQVLQLDPRRLPSPVRDEATPRGPMPHVFGPIPADAIRGRLSLDAMGGAPDEVRGGQVALLAFPGMTLLDLVGVWDPLGRIASMGVDEALRLEVIGATAPRVLCADGATLEVARVRPDLSPFDLLVLPGGRGAGALAQDGSFLEWIAGYPRNRLLASVCTGALLAGAAGRLRGLRATTHHLHLPALARYGAEATAQRVVDEGQTITAAGVTSALDLGLHLARRLYGAEVAARIAAQQEWTPR